jgi:hypothetical protein
VCVWWFSYLENFSCFYGYISLINSTSLAPCSPRMIKVISSMGAPRHIPRLPYFVDFNGEP